MNRHLVGGAVTALLIVLGTSNHAQQLQKITINYPTPSGATWPMYIAKTAGYYQQYVRDVECTPVGTDVTGRAAALQTNRADATLLTAPNYFRLEEAGYKVLANLADREVYAATVYLFARKALTANPKLGESIIKAHAEAIKRFYDDKAFAV